MEIMHYNKLKSIGICLCTRALIYQLNCNAFLCKPVNFRNKGVDKKQTRRFKSISKEVKTVFYREPSKLFMYCNGCLTEH